ncbi:ATP-binding protein [Lewinella sp. IMCC34183]|uniref:ATP-binding protein n=1 Tax=Lewinella sp. IMCC34183 TaxID=2248762 RepID=UPI000E23DEBF|nr:ATP-binding protein [Lewinella sp. IMCC34183]
MYLTLPHLPRWRWLLAVLVSCAVRALPGQSVYYIDPAYPVHPLGDRLEVVADAGRQLTVEDLRTDGTLDWSPRADFPALLDPGEVYHARLRLRRAEDLAGWQLHWEDGLHEDIAWIRGNGRIDVWAFAENRELWHRVTGADVADRDLEGPQVLDRVRFGLPPDTVTTVYLTASGNGLGIMPNLNLSLRAPDYLHHQPLYPRGPIYNAFNFGLTAIIFLYHLLLFAFLRERVYGWFSLWLLLGAITQGMTVGLEPAAWLGLTGGHARFTVWLLIPNSMLFAFWLFGRAFTDSARRFPVLDRWMLGLPVVMTLQLVVEILYVNLYDPPIMLTRFGYHYPGILVYALVGCGVAVALITRSDVLARVFGLGALLGSACIAIGSLWAMRYVQVPFDPFGTAILLQIVVYSVGIAYRRYLQRQEVREAELSALQDRNEVARMRDLEEVKSRFFANVSHEFRTPLSLIAGPLALARERAGRTGQVSLTEQDHAVMHGSIDRLKKLVEQLLELSSLDSGQLFLKLRRGGMVAFVRTLALSFSSLAEQANVSLDSSFPDERPDAFYDADKLETILVNLIANAIKYAPDRGRVSVVMRNEPDHVTVEVTDDGPGIPPEQLEQIFDRFYRVEGTGVEGSGIGLALTKELVEVYGGTISVHSAPGRGTTFRLRLPTSLETPPRGVMADPAEGDTGSVAKTERDPVKVAPAATGTTDPDEQAATVLVVEDSTELRQFIVSLLHPRYRILQAPDGMAGERMALEHVPDVVISDVMMPGKDGFALCNALKRNQKTSHIPFLLLTAKADQQSTLEGLNLGADVYLPKPFDPKELRLHVRNLLEARERIWEHFQRLDLTLLPEVDGRSVEDQFLQDVIGTIKRHLGDETLSVDTLAREVGYSRSQLSRKLKALTGKTPNRLITEMRLHEARRLLEKRTGTVSEIAYRVGYSNQSYFAKTFRQQFGELPSEVLEQSG